MRKIIGSVFLLLVTFSFSYGQGTVRGKISDQNGELLIGVSIVLKSNRSIGTTTDLDGNFSLKISDTTTQTLVVSYVSFQSIEFQVHPVKNGVVIKNFVMVPAANAIKEVVVTAKAVKSREYYTETIKKNSATTLDYISSETMKKTGDANVVNAVARVSGVSTNGSFITVRGIGDRYVKTSINEMRIPTLDPFTNNIKLDLFPSSLVDNIFITKTATPDLPGDWAGAYLSVQTKDYPDQLSVNFESTAGYNVQSTFKNFISSERSSTDWLGYDHNLREHDHSYFELPVLNPSVYQVMIASGLGSYFNTLGVTDQNWISDHNNGDTYFKLGLVQLGLLQPALINDQTAFTNARNAFMNGPYLGIAFNQLNAGAVKTGQSFADSWNPVYRKAPLDFSQSFSIGNQVNFFSKPLGFIGGFRYGTSVIYDPNSTTNRPYASSGLVQSTKDQEVSKETNGWSALFNVACKLNSNNSVSLMFMPNFTGVNSVRSATDLLNVTTTKDQFYEQRKQLIYQFKSQHYLPASKIKVETSASYTAGKSSAPDFKVLQYKSSIGTDIITMDPTNFPVDRHYRYLTENVFDSRLSVEFPLGSKTSLIRKLKFGGAYQHEDQRNDQYDYHVNFGNAITYAPSNDIEQILNLNNFAISDNTIPWFYSKLDLPVNNTFGRSSVAAGFAMVDYSIAPRLRASGGLRIEKAKIYTDVDLYDSLGYPRDYILRYYKAGYPNANPGVLDEISYLPSVNIIYKLKDDELAPVNLRANFSETVARPSIRELSNVTQYDYELEANVTGNPDLKMVKIKNYDLRFESYFKNGDNGSVSFFYKDFKDHIELESSDSYYWQNVDKSHVLGLELEGRKKITDHLEFRANLTFANSTTTFVRTRNEFIGGVKSVYYEDTIQRPMFGQAPYIANMILSYSADSIGLVLTLSYNIQGPRLVIASNNQSVPDVYELPRDLLDFKVTKKLSSHFSASLTSRNILNSTIRRAYKYPEGYTLDYDRYRYGTSFVFGIAYKI